MVFPPGPTAHLFTFSPREQGASLPLCPACITAFCDGNWATPLSFWGSTETLSPQSCLWRNAEGVTDTSFEITKIMRRRAVDWDVRDTELWCSCSAPLGQLIIIIINTWTIKNAVWLDVSFKVTEKSWSPPRLLPLEISNVQQMKDWEGHGFLTGRYFSPKVMMTYWKLFFHLEEMFWWSFFNTLKCFWCLKWNCFPDMPSQLHSWC